ncbi:MAG: sigma-70 family RNA polymerase sigma factor [Cytophagales bacterium]|nr:MAG: sigma-70 family RNA polymerase sigma factor [Cytophagales bacterium]
MSGTKRTLNSLTDTDLLAGIKTGTDIERAMRFVYRTHYRMMETYVVTNKGTLEDAADLIQEVMVTFIELVQMDKFRGETNVKSFLYTLTRNLWITELRKRGNEARQNEEFEITRDVVEQDISDYWLYRESLTAIGYVFDRLGNGCKQILTLFYFDNLSMKEILEKTNYENEQNVRNRKYKCLKELTDLVASSPAAFDNLKTALQNLK